MSEDTVRERERKREREGQLGSNSKELLVEKVVGLTKTVK